MTIHDPGRLGPVLVSSEDENITIDQMITEFDIEQINHYFDRSRQFRQERGNME